MSLYEASSLIVWTLILLSLGGISNRLDKVLKAFAVVGQGVDDRCEEITEQLREIKSDVGMIEFHVAPSDTTDSL